MDFFYKRKHVTASSYIYMYHFILFSPWEFCNVCEWILLYLIVLGPKF